MLKKFLLLLCIIACTAFPIICMEEYIKGFFSFFKGRTKEEQKTQEFLKAVEENNLPLVKELITYSRVRTRDKAGNYPLTIAVKNKNTQMVQELLSEHAYINGANNAGETPLILAIKQKDLPMVKLLLNVEKMDINQSDNDGNTPLMHAIKTHSIEIIKAILAEMPNPGVRNKEGKNAKDFATTPQEEQLIVRADERYNLFSILDNLAKTGSKPTQAELANIELFTTLTAFEFGILNFFRRAIESRNVDIVKAFVNKAIEVNKDFINQTLKDGRTPLLVAVDIIAREYVKKDGLKIIEFLLQKGANPNVVGTDGTTPVAAALRDPEIMKLLIERGADINYQIPPDNKTVLMLAIERGIADDVKTVLALKPNLSVRNSKGQNAREVAEEIIRAHGLPVEPNRREILDLIKEQDKTPKTPSTKPTITSPVSQQLISALQNFAQTLQGMSKHVLK